MSGPDFLILSSSEAYIALVIDQAPLRLNLLQQCSRAILRGVVNDDHLEIAIILAIKHGEALVQVLRAEFQVTMVMETIGRCAC